MASAKVALRPKNEAPRTTLPGLRGTTEFISSNATANITSSVRLQRLSSLCGIIGSRAELISSLVWGEAA